MGIIHKTLRDAEKAIDEGEFKDALDIVKNHLRRAHNVDGDFYRLRNYLSRYELKLGELKGAIDARIKTNRIPSRDEMRHLIEELRVEIRSILQLTKKLFAEEKFEI